MRDRSKTVSLSYRFGNLIVLGTLAASLVLCLILVRPFPEPIRAGQALGDDGFPLGSFALTERSGKTISDADVVNKVCVVSFIFTRCPLSCPRITTVMKGLQSKLQKTSVQLVCISVDPEHDTPQILSDYARRFDADDNRWWFLTGPKSLIEDLTTNRFKLALQANTPDDQDRGAEAFSHSDRLSLVDHGKVVGYFDSSDPKTIESLIAEARRRDAGAPPAWTKRLPAVNASLNASCAILLTLGWFFIRAGKWRAHALCMIAAVSISTLFLCCYLIYHYQVGSVPFRVVGPVRVVYFTILLSHTFLATFGVVPLVALTLNRALRRQFDRHALIASFTFPVWMYVSITGVIIYLMLYHLPVPSTPLSP